MQLDVKLAGGVPLSILEDALEVAKESRYLILDNMEKEMLSKLPASSRSSGNGFDAFMQRGLALKEHAPRLRVVTFARDRLPFLLGPGGETKRSIERDYNCMLDMGDTEASTTGASSGCVVHVFGSDKASCEAATRVVQELVCDVEAGAILSAVVKEVKEYGAFVEVI
jgi:polyribonucleotide nucleotidyltransferase